ncbi:hypothetical protein CVT24_009692 [Panaeolus cyanescens]|uniref:RING-type E3 ubiquitin transferase n=1 Tax=Panaeolus cyanescens TaxID=181874 RepID=A0A409Y9Q0_9AGAR|nr:hypothetical protein CVT24_009692 [Panaeolus cyanescens]
MPLANDFARIRTNQLFQLLNAHRVLFYTLASVISVSAVITNALKNYSNFYSVAIYLSKSSRSVLVLANFGVLLALLCGHVVQRIFFGALRPNEVERLYDRLWFFITESLLAFTIFRDDFDASFALMFGFLLFVKSFHWLASDRIEWMDQQPYPGPPLLFHFRMSLLFVILSTTDFLMFIFAAEHTLSVRVDGMVLFASEYAILMASVMNTILKYLLSSYDLRRAGRRGGENAPPWENKSVWVFYIELATDFTKLTTYLLFFIVIIASYGLPLNIVRDVYITARSFITRLRALHRYQTATRNMDQRYPNATEEELTAMSDRTCIICREEMSLPNPDVPQQPGGPNTTPKKLPCGHVFHFYCLRSWLERQQSCPTCRRNVLDVTSTPTQQPPAGEQLPNAAAAGPAQPQPGAVPLQNGIANNNPLGGFLNGRLFNNPVFGQRQGEGVPNGAPQPNPVIGQDAAAGQQPGIYINYQVQYQFPRNGDVPNGRTLAPIPPYPGFPGPGGEWQPWPRPQEQEAPTDTPSPVPTPTTQSAETGEGQPITTPETPSSSSSTDSGVHVEDEEDIPTTNETVSPREAARLAALSRFGQKAPAASIVQEKLVDTASKPQEDTTPTTTTASTSAAQPTPTPTTTATSASTPAPPHIPRLIPIQASYLRAPIEQPVPPFLFNGHVNGTPSSQSNNSRNQTYMPNVPLSQLPPNLTPEQLSKLDTLTRESIDERLRILEGVSGTVYRCIDELMMLRSSLPASSSSSNQAAPNQLSNGASSSRQEEKRRQVDVPAQDVNSS